MKAPYTVVRVQSNHCKTCTCTYEINSYDEPPPGLGICDICEELIDEEHSIPIPGIGIMCKSHETKL